MFESTAKILAALAAVAVVMTGTISVAAAGGAEAQGSAGITVLESLQVTEEASMDFGYVHRPSEGENTLELTYDDDTVTTNGSGDAHYVEGTSSSGLYRISGTPEQAIQMSVAADDFEDPSIVLEDAFIDGYSNESSGYLDESGEYAAGVGGVVTIESDASLGEHTTDVFVTVDYE